MAVKRKFEAELDGATDYSAAKQMKLIPFPSYEPDMDVDVTMSEPPLVNTDLLAFHSRLSSSVSTASSDYCTSDSYSPSESPSHSSLSLCHPPSTLNFSHTRPDCAQIPKLRVSCEAGPNGQRSMWSMCEECGAVQMLDS